MSKGLCKKDSQTIVYEHKSKEGKTYYTTNDFKTNREPPKFHNCEVCSPKKGIPLKSEPPKKAIDLYETAKIIERLDTIVVELRHIKDKI